MADGQVNVRFSVQDAEVVSQALAKMGTDGQAALAKLNAAGQAPTKGLTALDAIMSAFKSNVTGLAFSIGPLGNGLVALGPGGLAAAAGISLLVKAFEAVIESADAFAEKAQKLKETSENIGISTAQLQALEQEGAKLGLSTDQVSTAFERFTVNMGALRQGSGNLWTELTRINPSLRDQLASTRDSATAYDILGKAINSTSDAFERNQLAKAAFGKNSAAEGALAGGVAGQGGLGAITAAASDAGKIIQTDLIDRIATLKTESDTVGERVRNAFASMFAEPVLKNQLQARQEMEQIVNYAKNFSYSSAWAEFWGFLDKASTSDGLLGLLDKLYTSVNGNGGIPLTSGGASSVPFQDRWPTDAGGGVPLPGSRPGSAPSGSGSATGMSASARLAAMKEWTSILGPAATSTQQLQLRQAELDAEVEKAGGRFGNLAKQAMNYYSVQQHGADLQIQVQNGVAAATDLYAQKQSELNLLVQTGKLTQDQANASLDIYAQKTLPNVIAQQQIFKSSFPDLTKLAIDANNLRTQLDSNLSTALQGTTTDLIAMLHGTETLGVGLTNLATKMADAIAQAILMKTVIGPVANLLSGGLSSAFGGGSGSNISGAGAGDTVTVSALGNIFNRGNIVPFGTGGVFDGPTLFPLGLAGERGPEAIMPLSRGADGKLGLSGGGSAAPVVNIFVQNTTSSDVQVQQQPNDTGGVDLIVQITQAMNQQVSSGQFDNSMNARYGLKPGTIRR